MFAIDRAIHFVVLAFVAVAIFLVASNQLQLRHFVFRLVNAVEGTTGNPTQRSHGIVHTALRALELRSSTLYWVAAAATAYACRAWSLRARGRPVLNCLFRIT